MERSAIVWPRAADLYLYQPGIGDVEIVAASHDQREIATVIIALRALPGRYYLCPRTICTSTAVTFVYMYVCIRGLCHYTRASHISFFFISNVMFGT